MPKKTKTRIREDEEDDDEENLHFSDPATRQFFKKHGKFFSIGPWIIFEDGARIENGPSGFGNMLEPPDDDEHLLAKIRLKYYTRLHQEARTEFKDYRDSVVGNNDGFYGLNGRDEEEQIATLTKLRDKARKAAKKVKHWENEMEQTTPVTISARRKIEAEQQQRSQSHQDRLRRIKL